MKYNTLKITTLQSNKHTKQTNKPTHLPVLPQKNMTTKPFIQTIILNSGPKNAIEDAAAASIRRKTGSKILTTFPTMLFLEDWNLAGFESTRQKVLFENCQAFVLFAVTFEELDRCRLLSGSYS